MRVSAFSEAANGDNDNEDWVSTSAGLIIVLDGATARTDTGCIHGTSWYATHLGSAVSSLASDRDVPLQQALGLAIRRVADLHRACILSHPGTPSAAVAIVRVANDVVDYLLLGDITIVLDANDEPQVITDDRVDTTAQAERALADRYPIGSPEKHAALIRMKHAELAVRNKPGGYWVAATDPTVITHALTGKTSVNDLHRVAVLTDGAARIVQLFGLLSWKELLNLLSEAGPDEAVRRIRSLEAADPLGNRWPRNKRSDDATIVFAQR